MIDGRRERERYDAVIYLMVSDCKHNEDFLNNSDPHEEFFVTQMHLSNLYVKCDLCIGEKFTTLFKTTLSLKHSGI